MLTKKMNQVLGKLLSVFLLVGISIMAQGYPLDDQVDVYINSRTHETDYYANKGVLSTLYIGTSFSSTVLENEYRAHQLSFEWSWNLKDGLGNIIESSSIPDGSTRSFPWSHTFPQCGNYPFDLWLTIRWEDPVTKAKKIVAFVPVSLIIHVDDWDLDNDGNNDGVITDDDESFEYTTGDFLVINSSSKAACNSRPLRVFIPNGKTGKITWNNPSKVNVYDNTGALVSSGMTYSAPSDSPLDLTFNITGKDISSQQGDVVFALYDNSSGSIKDSVVFTVVSFSVDNIDFTGSYSIHDYATGNFLSPGFDSEDNNNRYEYNGGNFYPMAVKLNSKPFVKVKLITTPSIKGRINDINIDCSGDLEYGNSLSYSLTWSSPAKPLYDGIVPMAMQNTTTPFTKIEKKSLSMTWSSNVFDDITTEAYNVYVVYNAPMISNVKLYNETYLDYVVSADKGGGNGTKVDVSNDATNIPKIVLGNCRNYWMATYSTLSGVGPIEDFTSYNGDVFALITAVSRVDNSSKTIPGPGGDCATYACLMRVILHILGAPATVEYIKISDDQKFFENKDGKYPYWVNDSGDVNGDGNPNLTDPLCQIKAPPYVDSDYYMYNKRTMLPAASYRANDWNFHAACGCSTHWWDVTFKGIHDTSGVMNSCPGPIMRMKSIKKIGDEWYESSY